MTYRHEALEKALRTLTERCEDIWIERASFEDLLIRQCGFSPEQLKLLATRAKSDLGVREKARQVFSEMQRAIEAARKALIEELVRQPPPSGKPN